MKNKLALLFLLLPFIAMSQDNPVEGKWKVVRVNNGVIIDFRNNWEEVTPELNETLKGRPDSLLGLEMFRAMARKYSDYYFVFRKDWIYQEIMNGKVRNDTAVYFITENEKTIYMRKASNSEDIVQAMNYNLTKEGILELSVLFMDKRMTLELEKVSSNK